MQRRLTINTSHLVVFVSVLFLLAIVGGCAKKPIPVPLSQPSNNATAVKATSGNQTSINATTNQSNLETETLNATETTTTTMPTNATTVIGTNETTSTNATQNEAFGIRISEGRTDAPMLPIYFDFNKYNIRPDMIPRMENNAKFLLAHPNIKIQIQGNCDERGSEAYNLALGEKRAEAAKKYLVNLGVAPDRIETISFGKDKPLDPRHCPAAWAKNRRDDFVIISQ